MTRERLGKYYAKLGRYEEAVFELQAALVLAQRLNDDLERGEILLLLGDELRRTAPYWDEALAQYQAAMQVFEKDPARVADCLRKMASVFLYKGMPRQALDLCEKSLAVCHQLGSTARRGIYKGLQHEVWAYDLLGQWAKAVQLAEEARALVEEVASGDWLEEARSLLYMGNAYRLARRSGEAEWAYDQAIKLLSPFLSEEDVQAQLIFARAELGLAKVYLKQTGREAEAQQCLDATLSLRYARSVDFRFAEILGEQGELLLKQGTFAEAEIYLQQASDHFRRSGNIFYRAIVLATLCELYYRTGDFDRLFETAQMAREADASLAQRGDPGLIDYHLARIELFLGKAQVDQGHNLAAFDAFISASQKALAFNALTFNEVCEELIAELDRQLELLGIIQFCTAFIEFWRKEKASLQPGDDEAVTGWLRRIQEKSDEVRIVLPVDDKSVHSPAVVDSAGV